MVLDTMRDIKTLVRLGISNHQNYVRWITEGLN
jgi:hypothetical protein